MEELTHKSIAVKYEMYEVSDGKETLIEATTEEQPLRVITDFGMVPIAAFEEKIKDLATGDSFELVLAPEEAFGEFVAERVVDLDKAVFSPNGQFDDTQIRPGVIVPLQNENGQRFMAQIVEVGEEKVKIDLNHPLAGKSVKFKGTIIESHEATQDEIMALLNRMNHHGCGGCGGGSCSGSCGHCGDGECGEGGCGNCHH